MKKISLLICIALLLSFYSAIYGAMGVVSTVFDEECWIAAEHFKLLNGAEAYLPFVEIRERNYRLRTSGASVRTILADFSIIRRMPITGLLVKNDSKDVDFNGLLLNFFGSIGSSNDYQNKVMQFRAITIFQAEMIHHFNALRTQFGSKYLYRFYHLMVNEFETTAGTYPVSSQSDSSTLANALLLNTGIYNSPFAYMQDEIEDSRIATNRINQSMPFKPEAYIGYVTSPFVTVSRTTMDTEMKNYIKSRFGNKVSFRITKMAQVQYYMITDDDLLYMLSFAKYFTDDAMAFILNHYQSKFGPVDVGALTQTNLHDYLITLKI